MSIKEKTQGFTLRDKSACIIGCGGLGCNIAVHLIGAGIGKLYICDFDTVCESNLNRQFLYTHSDIGKSKCEIMKKRLLDFSPNSDIESHNKKICSPEDMNFAKDADIIILAVDNSKARKIIGDYCRDASKPLVSGGIDGFYGIAYLYIPDYTPCPECAGLNESRNAELSVSSSAGIIGSAQAALATRFLLTNDKSIGGKLLIYDETQFHTLKIHSSAECTICAERFNNRREKT